MASPGHGGQGVFFEFLVTDPPHKEAPLGAAFIVPDGERGNNPCIIAEYYAFHTEIIHVQPPCGRSEGSHWTSGSDQKRAGIIRFF